MKAFELHPEEGFDALKLVERSRPIVGPGDVRVRVQGGVVELPRSDGGPRLEKAGDANRSSLGRGWRGHRDWQRREAACDRRPRRSGILSDLDRWRLCGSAPCECLGRIARRDARGRSCSSRAGVGEDSCTLFVRAGIDASVCRCHGVARAVRGGNGQAGRDGAGAGRGRGLDVCAAARRAPRARRSSPRRARRKSGRASRRWARP